MITTTADTTSLDAVIAQAEREFPEWLWHIGNSGTNRHDRRYDAAMTFGFDTQIVTFGASPAAALGAAMARIRTEQDARATREQDRAALDLEYGPEVAKC